jgi:hypothetical protein
MLPLLCSAGGRRPIGPGPGQAAAQLDVESITVPGADCFGFAGRQSQPSGSRPLLRIVQFTAAPAAPQADALRLLASLDATPIE